MSQPNPVAPTEARLRAGDADRDRTAALLGEALALGYLTPDEFADRTEGALRATTLGELDRLAVDLPAERFRPVRPTPTSRVLSPSSGVSTGPGPRARVQMFVALSLLMVLIWTVTAIAAGPYYFWPVWPILGTGMGLVSHLRRDRLGRQAWTGVLNR